MEFLNVANIIIYLFHVSTALYTRNPGDQSLLLQAELNPEVSYSYGDSLNFNYPSVPLSGHNSVEKPIEEPQEYIPPQSVGAAMVPLLPPPAVPVNAVAANVPSANGAVYLGSGSIGVVRLGNGAYALGSGSLGYSDGRSQTRPSTNVPVYPRLPPSPNLIPAAVPSQPPTPPIQLYPEYGLKITGMVIRDPNAYEFLTPEQVRFGMVNPRPPRPLRMHFATPTTPVQPTNPEFTLTIPPGIPPNSNPMMPVQQYFIQHK